MYIKMWIILNSYPKQNALYAFKNTKFYDMFISQIFKKYLNIIPLFFYSFFSFEISKNSPRFGYKDGNKPVGKIYFPPPKDPNINPWIAYYVSFECGLGCTEQNRQRDFKLQWT